MTTPTHRRPSLSQMETVESVIEYAKQKADNRFHYLVISDFPQKYFETCFDEDGVCTYVAYIEDPNEHNGLYDDIHITN